MKKLILPLILLLSNPMYSQISYDDVMSISSEKMFKKVMIENGWEFDSREGELLFYGYEIERDSINGNKSSKWSVYGDNGEFVITFSRNSFLSSSVESEYDLIVKNIKKNCKYYDVISPKDSEGSIYDFVCYSCSESEYKGLIGFMVTEGKGVIRNFIIEEQEYKIIELIGVLLFCLVVGLIVRKKGDNTMDTLGKGCGCVVLVFVLVVSIMVYVMFEHKQILKLDSVKEYIVI